MTNNKKNSSKYFVVHSREDAIKIKNYTGLRYYVFEDNDNRDNIVFTFPKTSKVFEAWDLILKKII